MHAITISVYQLRHSIRSKEQRTYQKLKRPLLQTIAGCTNVGGTRRAKMKLTRRNASPRHRNILETIRRDDCKVLIKQVLFTGLGKAKPKLQRKELRRPFVLLGSSSSPRWYCDEFTDRNYNAAHVLYDHITMGAELVATSVLRTFSEVCTFAAKGDSASCHFAILFRWKVRSLYFFSIWGNSS